MELYGFFSLTGQFLTQLFTREKDAPFVINDPMGGKPNVFGGSSEQRRMVQTEIDTNCQSRYYSNNRNLHNLSYKPYGCL